MDKKLILAIVLSISTLWIFNYYNKSKQVVQQTTAGAIPTDIRPGQGYVVPSAQDLARPLNKEVDFIDKKINQPEEIKEFQTDLCSVSFSNYGGVISGVEFKKHLGKNKQPLRTIHQKNFYQKDETSFLLALDEKTPYFYDLAGYKDAGDQIQIVYQTKADNWFIKKIYTLYKNSYKIDLTLDFEPRKDAQPIHPRIFFAAPFVGEIPKDVSTGFTIGVSGKSIDKINSKNLNQAWIAPSIFGAEDKYFANCLIADQQGFIQRGFFKQESNSLFPILEGQEVKEKSEFNLSFYVGPKSVEDLGAVDERLEGLLSFGWLSWICKLLLKLLALLYSFLGNFGVAIILMTILLKIPFLPLTISGGKKMEEFQKYQPTINRIRLKYKKDLKMQQAEIMKFHKDHNISPTAPLMGCLPQLIQLPILFGLYKVLGGYIDLYQAPFFGWITDLSAKDPYYVLPILMGFAMLWQQSLTPSKDAKQKTMMMFMPLIMVAVFINFPAGLVLYWLTNNMATIAETYLRKRFFK